MNNKQDSSGSAEARSGTPEMDALLKTIDLHIKRAFYFTTPRQLAVISGAGIAGLAASFVLLARGFEVIIAETRTTFNRFNVINLDVDTQRFLKQFGLLNEFEQSVAARIKTHTEVLFSDKKELESSDPDDVSKLQPSKVSFEPQFFNSLFKKNGIYSVRIKDLQIFLARKALEAGARIFGGVEVKVLDRTEAEGVSEVEVAGMMLQPNLFFVAEGAGARSTTAEQLGLKMEVRENVCTGENWIFGNVEYGGQETFVVSMIDISEKNLEIANIICNAKIKQINIAVTSKASLSEKLIQDTILAIVNQLFPLNTGEKRSVIDAVERPVQVNNKQRAQYSIDNVFCIGDAAGHSSPLAGMGGTLGLTLVPRTIEQLMTDYERNSKEMHDNFRMFSEAYTSRWIEKSKAVKEYCLRKKHGMRFFDSKGQDSGNQEQTSSQGSELALKSGVPK